MAQILNVLKVCLKKNQSVFYYQTQQSTLVCSQIEKDCYLKLHICSLKVVHNFGIVEDLHIPCLLWQQLGQFGINYMQQTAMLGPAMALPLQKLWPQQEALVEWSHVPQPTIPVQETPPLMVTVAWDQVVPVYSMVQLKDAPDAQRLMGFGLIVAHSLASPVYGQLQVLNAIPTNVMLSGNAPLGTVEQIHATCLPTCHGSCSHQVFFLAMKVSAINFKLSLFPPSDQQTEPPNFCWLNMDVFTKDALNLGKFATKNWHHY